MFGCLGVNKDREFVCGIEGDGNSEKWGGGAAVGAAAGGCCLGQCSLIVIHIETNTHTYIIILYIQLYCTYNNT